MKILKLLSYLFISSLILVGCSNDDNDNVDSNSIANQANNKQPLGSSANDLLSDTNFSSITVEIVSVEGFEPTAAALSGFTQFLEDRLFKPEGITITQRSVVSSGKAPFSIEEIVEIENDTRTLFNEEDDIAVYIYFADGSREDDNGDEQITLGSAYLNTSIVIYEDTLRNLTTNFNAPSLSTIENATLNHEFVHLLGLVNIGTPLQSDHEDEEESNHCNVVGCLMQSAIQFGNGVMGINNVPELDPLCIADLQANGGK
ncbi:hypothetical protein [Aquimarina pacifica]|uniref:hypothetical protein n=1 Tax=Aquimarina pacifica TaxID=1296415 RepID=UPI00047276D1|nr:hypothetical protein [Aquimarina pacifica]